MFPLFDLYYFDLSNFYAMNVPIPSCAVFSTFLEGRRQSCGSGTEPQEKSGSVPQENLEPNPILKKTRKESEPDEKKTRIGSSEEKKTDPDPTKTPGTATIAGERTQGRNYHFFFSPLSHSCFSNACQAWVDF